MNSISPQSWFLKCGLAAALSLFVYAAISIAGPKAPPLPTSRDGAVTLLDRYVEGPVPDVLVAGSSLTARLNEDYFDTPNLKVWALPADRRSQLLTSRLRATACPKPS